MKKILLILFISFIGSCYGQSANEQVEVPYGQDPITPTKEALDSLDLIPFGELVEEIVVNEANKTIRYYRKDNVLFNGWSIEIFENNEHRFRYMHFTDGLYDWQIGYFDNGELGHDFHLKDGINCGSARMWQKGGCLYISTYFLEGGFNDRLALAWHDNCRLSREAMYDNGKIVYEVKFDTLGNIVKKEGDIPSKYK